MRSHDGVDQRMAHDLADGHVDRFHAGPFGENFTRARDIVIIQREMDIGEVMTELAKAEREINDDDVPEERQRKTDSIKDVIDRSDGQRPRQHDDEPCEHAVFSLARVEAQRGGFRMVLQQREDRVALRERA
jgi:hypothetical protein